MKPSVAANHRDAERPIHRPSRATWIGLAPTTCGFFRYTTYFSSVYNPFNYDFRQFATAVQVVPVAFASVETLSMTLDRRVHLLSKAPRFPYRFTATCLLAKACVSAFLGKLLTGMMASILK